MLSIGVSEFRANMTSILQRVQDGEVISLLLHNTEIAKLVPPDFAQRAAREELVRLRATAVVGDVLSPLEEAWHAGGEE